jgi:hypothetical protein
MCELAFNVLFVIPFLQAFLMFRHTWQWPENAETCSIKLQQLIKYTVVVIGGQFIQFSSFYYTASSPGYRETDVRMISE